MIFSQTVDFPEAEPPATPIRRGGPLFSARRHSSIVSDLDLIRIQLGHWIRVRIGNPDKHPGRPNGSPQTEKLGKFMPEELSRLLQGPERF